MPRMFLNGTAISGGADHHLVGDAPLVATTTTAPRYRFHAVDGRYPALQDIGEGAAVEGEVASWRRHTSSGVVTDAGMCVRTIPDV